MSIKIRFDNHNTRASGLRIYHSNAPFTTENLPNNPIMGTGLITEAVLPFYPEEETIYVMIETFDETTSVFSNLASY